jgi:hypothetical protein
VLLFCCHTPAHEVLYRQVFLPSAPKGFEVCSTALGIGGPGDYLSDEFLRCIRVKLDLVIRSVEENLGDAIVWCDVDIPGGRYVPEVDRLSSILKAFNDHFGTLFTDADRVSRRIREDIAPKVAADQAYQNARKNTPNSARIEHDKVLAKVMLTLLKDDTQVYKQFVENESFKRFVTDMVYTITNE